MELISGKMTSKGQITIPKELRDKMNVNEGDQFRFLVNEKGITIEPIRKKSLSQVIGRVKVNEPIDVDKMRKFTHEQATKEIFSEGRENG